MVGHPGYAPGVSPSQAARIAIFLVPDKWFPRLESHQRPPPSQSGALLLSYGEV